MRVKTQEGLTRNPQTRMRRFLHSGEPEESMNVELWVGVAQSGWSPVIWIPVKGDPGGGEAEGRGLGKNQAQ